MKKVLLSTIPLMVLSFSMNAQVLKTKWTGGASIPLSKNISSDRGAVIFSEDFSNGIPSSWTNTTVSGPVDWKYTTVGHTGDYATPSIASTTSSNGWIIIDSDADNFSGGGAEDSQLMTPVIDCSNYTHVKVEFQQMFRRWQSDVTTVRVTTDGGLSYTDFEINQTITQSGTDNPDYVNIDITSAIAGDPTNVQIVLWWQGAWDYGWQIDDFFVKEIDPNDLLLKRPGLSQDVTYYQVPETQIQALNFSAFVENVGYSDQTNVYLEVDVNDGNSSVFNSNSATVSTFTVGTTDSLFLASTFTPSGIGAYAVAMTAHQNESDDEISNNSMDLDFSVTDTIYAIDNGVYGGQWWNLDDGAGNSNAFEIGAVYEIVNDDFASSASIYIGDNSSVDAILDVLIYEYDVVNSVYNAVGSSDSYTITSNDLGNWVTVRFSADVQVSAGTDYLVSVIHYGGPEYLYIGYGTNSSFTGATISNDGNGAAWANQPRTPMIRLNLGQVGLGKTEVKEIKMNVYPNPTSEMVNIECGNQIITSISVYDICGKIVNSTNGSNLKKQVDFSNLPNGTYLIEVSTESGVLKEIIVKN
ncbi:MAG: T9SS type A sorting domain-containing protein [Flavobacteriales bacterium]|nr:T9SS type A sorting domain-containing protein [Flavobacteriales bacterium]